MRAGIGLDIGSTAVRVAAVRSTKNGPVLMKYAKAVMQEGETAAEIPDPQEITTAVKSLVRGERLPKAPVSLGLANQRMVAREVEIPWVPAKDLREALPLLASDLLPMPVEESVLDFLAFQEVMDDDGARMLRGLLVAANEEVVMSSVEAVERAGLRVDRVDFGPLAALHATCDPYTPDIEAVVDVGSNTTCLVVHEASRPTFVRVMARGGTEMTQSLAEHLQIEVDVAEAWKVAVEQMWPTMSAQDHQLTRAALDVAAESLIDEIRSSITFYRTNTGNTVSRVWLVGGGGSQYGLDYQLREALHLEVLRGAPLARLAGDQSGMAGPAQPELATAIGLAVGVAA